MKFSVIVPVYNVERYLRECLDSLIAQTFADWEAICVDDGSTDGSAAILDEYAARDSRIKVLRQENSGVSAARNRGLEVAKGEYLWFVDGDDIVAPDALQTIASAVDEFNSPDIVQFLNEKFWNDSPRFAAGGRPTELFDLEKTAERRRAFDIHAQWLLGSSAVYSRAAFGCERFAGFANCEDSLWGRRAFYKARSLVFIDRALYGYRQREGSANNVWTKARWNDFCRVSWIMTKEGLHVKGLLRPVAMAGLRSMWYARAYRKRIVD